MFFELNKSFTTVEQSFQDLKAWCLSQLNSEALKTLVANKLDEFLKLTDREILQDAGKISHKIACDKAESEFEKYRIIQDQIYLSDFDKYINELEKFDVSNKGE